MPSGVVKYTKEDKLWALKVKERDLFKCVICGKTENLNSHHIIVRENKDTKYDINNGLTLCSNHHIFDRKISAHNNPLGLFLWMMRNRKEQLKYLLLKQEGLL